MSTWGDGGVRPARWAVERFGDRAGRLATAIPLQLARAHEQARRAHDKAEVKKRSPYGATLAQAVRENLVDTARGLGGTVRNERGYEYPVVNGYTLFPFKYANRPAPLESARLPSQTSETRRRMLTGYREASEQLALWPDEAVATGEKPVCVFFTADWEKGIHAIHWGIVDLLPNRYFTWLYRQQLPVVPRRG